MLLSLCRERERDVHLEKTRGPKNMWGRGDQRDKNIHRVHKMFPLFIYQYTILIFNQAKPFIYEQSKKLFDNLTALLVFSFLLFSHIHCSSDRDIKQPFAKWKAMLVWYDNFFVFFRFPILIALLYLRVHAEMWKLQLNSYQDFTINHITIHTMSRPH